VGARPMEISDAVISNSCVAPSVVFQVKRGGCDIVDLIAS
jgi:hypothetical protein